MSLDSIEIRNVKLGDITVLQYREKTALSLFDMPVGTQQHPWKIVPEVDLFDLPEEERKILVAHYCRVNNVEVGVAVQQILGVKPKS